ncbi:MAG: (2Fe-2S) ferredoxin domain-containing protein [Brachymonas sp.]|nr:(2Fe-2S) ferredoxin domain-containing protein [Brachymonas sp.]
MSSHPSPSGLAPLSDQASTQPPYFVRHIFFCCNQREAGKDCCAKHGAEEAAAHCKKRLKDLGLHGEGQVRVSRSGCLGRCHAAPVAVVYPEGVWYSYRNLSDIDEIVSRHLQGGQVVTRLLIAADAD